MTGGGGGVCFNNSSTQRTGTKGAWDTDGGYGIVKRMYSWLS